MEWRHPAAHNIFDTFQISHNSYKSQSSHDTHIYSKIFPLPTICHLKNNH